jgi:4-hydroxybenzoate polyprenyltransferase
MKNYIKIARPDHWVKNAFILPGVAIAILLTDFTFSYDVIVKFILGFFSTCFIASANYVINEWLDAEFDKYHPTKKYRPVVSENMKLSYVLVEYALLIVLGMALAFCVNRLFAYMEIWLLIMGVLYNVKPVRTKDIPYLDVLSESINNMIRLLLGWFIITSAYQPPISILIGYWFAGAFLMATKRFAEYRMIGDPSVAGLYRKSFAYYTETSLLVSSFFLRHVRNVFYRSVYDQVQNGVHNCHALRFRPVLLLSVHSVQTGFRSTKAGETLQGKITAGLYSGAHRHTGNTDFR